MENNYRIFIVSLVFAILTVFIFSNLSGEISVIGLFPGFLLNWLLEQILIEIFNEPYFMLDNHFVF